MYLLKLFVEEHDILDLYISQQLIYLMEYSIVLIDISFDIFLALLVLPVSLLLQCFFIVLEVLVGVVLARSILDEVGLCGFAVVLDLLEALSGLRLHLLNYLASTCLSDCAGVTVMPVRFLPSEFGHFVVMVLAGRLSHLLAGDVTEREAVLLRLHDQLIERHSN